MIISKFSEKARQVESDIMQIMLDSMGYETIRIPHDSTATAEGGEFYYCPEDSVLFAGACRNNVKGAEWVAQEFNVEELVIMKSNAFHIDTLFTPVINKHPCSFSPSCINEIPSFIIFIGAFSFFGYFL